MLLSDGDEVIRATEPVPGATPAFQEYGWSGDVDRTRCRARTALAASLAAAIALILQDRREDGLRGVPPDATLETVTVK